MNSGVTLAGQIDVFEMKALHDMEKFYLLIPIGVFAIALVINAAMGEKSPRTILAIVYIFALLTFIGYICFSFFTDWSPVRKAVFGYNAPLVIIGVLCLIRFQFYNNTTISLGDVAVIPGHWLVLGVNKARKEIVHFVELMRTPDTSRIGLTEVMAGARLDVSVRQVIPFSDGSALLYTQISGMKDRGALKVSRVLQNGVLDKNFRFADLRNDDDPYPRERLAVRRGNEILSYAVSGIGPYQRIFVHDSTGKRIKEIRPSAKVTLQGSLEALSDGSFLVGGYLDDDEDRAYALIEIPDGDASKPRILLRLNPLMKVLKGQIWVNGSFRWPGGSIGLLVTVNPSDTHSESMHLVRFDASQGETKVFPFSKQFQEQISHDESHFSTKVAGIFSDGTLVLMSANSFTLLALRLTDSASPREDPEFQVTAAASLDGMNISAAAVLPAIKEQAETILVAGRPADGKIGQVELRRLDRQGRRDPSFIFSP